MKHNTNILFLLLALLLSACSDELYYDYLSLTPRTLGIMSDGSVFTGDMNLTLEADNPHEQTISIKAQNAAWSIENPVAWIKLSQSSGTQGATITLKAETNPSLESRVAVLNLVSKESELPISRHITITQYGQIPYITPDETAITLTGGAGYKDVEVSTNLKEWTATTTYDWIAATRSGDKVRITVNENTGSERTGYVAVGQGVTTKTIKVTQQEAGVTLGTALEQYGVDGSTQTLTFNAEASWTASTTYSWIDIKKTSGNAGANSIAVEVLRNTSKTSRSGSLYFYIGTKQKLRVDVSQQGVEIAATPTKLNFESNGGKLTFQVQANTAWTLTPSANWIAVSPSQGQAGTTAVEVTVQDVGGTSSRNGKIEVRQSEGSTVMATVNVSQQGWQIDDFTSLPDFPVTGGTQTVDINTTGVWIATTTASWIHLSPMSGTGNGTLSITVDENTGDNSRQGVVKVAVGSIERGIAVKQVGRYVNISCSEAVKGSTPCSVKVTVGSNTSWTASADIDWMTVSPASGTGNAELTVSFADNPSSKSRTGNVIVTSGSENKRLSFTQPGRYLTLSHTSVTLTKDGGTSELVTVSTDGKYSVTASDTWLTVKQTDSGFTVTAAANGNAPRTGTVTVALTDLKEGEALSQTLDVRQKGKDTPVDVEDWNRDEDWNVGNGETTQSDTDPSDVDKDGFGEDEDWNPDNYNPNDNKIDGHEYVDLALPSGLLWATCNVGATNPEEYGNYYAWGETRTKSNYTTSNSATNEKEISMLKSESIIDSNNNLTPAYDAAFQNWGGSWRMPTKEDIQELVNNCSYSWTTINGVQGAKVTGPNGNSIFFPATGWYDGTILKYDSSAQFPAADYWTSTLDAWNDPKGAYHLRILENRFSCSGYWYSYECCRYGGHPIRPVIKP